MLLKIFIKIKICLILVIIHENQSFLILKDEFNGEIISVFVGLKSKMYSLVSVDGKEVKKAKRVIRGTAENASHKKFVDFLFSGKVVRHSMKRIQSTFRRIGTYNLSKISLSCFDYKRYILDDGINSLAYFHKVWKVSKTG